MNQRLVLSNKCYDKLKWLKPTEVTQDDTLGCGPIPSAEQNDTSQEPRKLRLSKWAGLDKAIAQNKEIMREEGWNN